MTAKCQGQTDFEKSNATLNWEVKTASSGVKATVTKTTWLWQRQHGTLTGRWESIVSMSVASLCDLWKDAGDKLWGVPYLLSFNNSANKHSRLYYTSYFPYTKKPVCYHSTRQCQTDFEKGNVGLQWEARTAKFWVRVTLTETTWPSQRRLPAQMQRDFDTQRGTLHGSNGIKKKIYKKTGVLRATSTKTWS